MLVDVAAGCCTAWLSVGAFCADMVNELRASTTVEYSRYIAWNISYLRPRGSPTEETCK